MQRSCRGRGQQSQTLDAPQDRGEQWSRDRHLRHLEHDAPGAMHRLRTDLDEFVPQRRQRPVFHGGRQRQPPQEVAQIIRQGEELQTHLSGRVAAALMAKAPELLAKPPSIEKVDVLAAKMPR